MEKWDRFRLPMSVAAVYIAAAGIIQFFPMLAEYVFAREIADPASEVDTARCHGRQGKALDFRCLLTTPRQVVSVGGTGGAGCRFPLPAPEPDPKPGRLERLR
mgnify:CR=1 FL=1